MAPLEIEDGVVGMNEVLPDVLAYIALLLVIEFIDHLFDLGLIRDRQGVLFRLLLASSVGREPSLLDDVSEVGAHCVAVHEWGQVHAAAGRDSHAAAHCLGLLIRQTSLKHEAASETLSHRLVLLLALLVSRASVLRASFGFLANLVLDCC